MIGFIAASLAIFEPNPEPMPVEVRPVLQNDAWQWTETQAWYRNAILPDDSKLELKSKIQLTKKQWQQLADTSDDIIFRKLLG